MNFDIVLVTYNSAKWIENNIKSILSSNYDLKRINLYFFDNASTDDTIKILEKIKEKYSKKFNDFQIVKGKKNYGFGIGNNKGSKLGKSEYIFFLNIDTEVNQDTFMKIESEILDTKDKSVGMWELRQQPYEHPKYYDPITGEVSWASGACFIIKRDIFKKVHGFDKHIFMYCEDVELSWHVRKIGYKIKYLYNVPISHFSYENEKTFKINQYVYGITNNIYMRYKYGSIKKILSGYRLFVANKRTLGNNEDIKKVGVKKVKKLFSHNETVMSLFGILAFISRIKYIFSKRKANFSFIGFDYELAKDGGFYVPKNSSSNPKVSIIVRTCGRPDTLRETLISIERQTYKNIEVVVVEDGKNTSGNMISKEFSHMNILYKATGEKVGRSAVANIALSLATGKYFNFLDDDDLFYPDHVETLVNEISNSDKKIIYSTAFETAIEVVSKSPYIYNVKKNKIRYSFDFNILRILSGNYFPIQTVMFERKVYEEIGGINENMDALEDWDFWIRCALKFPFQFVEKTTSIYRVPFLKKHIVKRNKFLLDPLKEIYEKYSNEDIKIKAKDVIYFNKIQDYERSMSLLEITRKDRIKRAIKRIIGR